MNEAVGTLNRRISDADVTPWFSSPMYPKYYMVRAGVGSLQGEGVALLYCRVGRGVTIQWRQ